ncbi:MAG: N-acetylgalactosamine-4-sulfatase [Opitutus sp.]|nr:N-acetylgalactosamine-4-sulfatase [Opitutus sp.]
MWTRILFPGLIALLSLVGGRALAADRPNIIFIVADDLGYGELGSFGGRDVPTPHIDSIARAGVRFTNAYVTAPFCAASRAALVTGRYQTRFGFEFNPIGAVNADPTIGLPVSETTLADALRGAGYVTSLIGKWHLGGTARFNPQRRGFDEFFGFLHEGHYYVPPPWPGHVTWLRRRALPDGGQGRWTSPDGHTVWSTHIRNFEPDYDADNPVLRNSQPVEEKSNLTDAFSREAEDFIVRHKAQPFFLYLAYNSVHSPMQGADAYLKKFASIADIHRRIFAAMLAQLDDGVGRVLARVRNEGLEERTLIVFISDNGGPTRELTSSNLPLRGEKGQLLEGGIRIPMLLQWKGRVPAGREESRMVSSLELFPTATAAAGLKAAANLDGVDLLPHLTVPGTAPIRATHYWRVGPLAAFRAGDWKIVRERGETKWQLYHLAADIGEAHELGTSQPAKLAELEAAWRALDAKMIEPLWGGGRRQAR